MTQYVGLQLCNAYRTWDVPTSPLHAVCCGARRADVCALGVGCAGNDAMSDAQICAEIATLIIGGYETTAK